MRSRAAAIRRSRRQRSSELAAEPLYDLLDGKTAITAPMALRLERMFGGSAEFWLGLQVQYNLWRAGRDLKAA
ncbi:hypothetical protein HYPGJ_31189 [Hyphomicrobium sp. GJ21]|nr:hypothetical protein HYPGJ_31189 [Hyphomicrobium sp. GJ21]